MGGIFISYRREDSGPYAGRLRDTLSHHFGVTQVFRDIERINPGERLPRNLPDVLVPPAECNAVHITDEGWDDQVVRLNRALETAVERRAAAPSPPPVARPRPSRSRMHGSQRRPSAAALR
jgi:hypothetical protein